jgi:hypothetical protein
MRQLGTNPRLILTRPTHRNWATSVSTAAGSATCWGIATGLPRMRVDLIPKRDRFIPGWYSQLDTLRAELTRSEWRWPSRLCRAVWASQSSLLQSCRWAARSPSGSPEISIQINDQAGIDGQQGSKRGPVSRCPRWVRLGPARFAGRCQLLAVATENSIWPETASESCHHSQACSGWPDCCCFG